MTKLKEYYKKNLQIYKKVFGYKDPDTALPYNNLAVYENLCNKYDKAEKYYEKGLQMRFVHYFVA